MKTKELAGIAAQFAQDFKSGAIFLYDIATERVIAAESIEAVKINEDGAIQINMNGKWLFRAARCNSKLPERFPSVVVRGGQADAGVSKRVAFVRDMLQSKQVVILDMTTGYLVPPSMICSVDDNGAAVQISLCPKWHMGRQENLCDCTGSAQSWDEYSEDETEEQAPRKKAKGAKARKRVTKS